MDTRQDLFGFRLTVGKAVRFLMKESGVYRGKVQMKLGAASRYLVEDQGLLLRRLRRMSAV